MGCPQSSRTTVEERKEESDPALRALYSELMAQVYSGVSFRSALTDRFCRGERTSFGELFYHSVLGNDDLIPEEVFCSKTRAWLEKYKLSVQEMCLAVVQMYSDPATGKTDSSQMIVDMLSLYRQVLVREDRWHAERLPRSRAAVFKQFLSSAYGSFLEDIPPRLAMACFSFLHMVIYQTLPLPPSLSLPGPEIAPPINSSCVLTQEFLILLVSSLPDQYLHGKEDLRVGPAVWTNLYDSSEQGLSFNRLRLLCFQYPGPTLSLFLLCSGTLVVLAVDEQWRVQAAPWGGTGCLLMELQPALKRFQHRPSSNLQGLLLYIEVPAGSLHVRESSRHGQSGIFVGDALCPKLTVSTDLTSAQLHMEEHHLTEGISCVEVWGCSTHQAHALMRASVKRDEGDVEKRQKVRRDLMVDCDVDKKILEMAGVHVSHAEQS